MGRQPPVGSCDGGMHLAGQPLVVGMMHKTVRVSTLLTRGRLRAALYDSTMDCPAGGAAPAEDGCTGKAGATQYEPPIVHTHMAYFFIPLPEPLALPDRYEVRLGAPTPGDRWRAYQQDATAMPPPVEHTAGSLMFHRATCPSPQANSVDALFNVATAMLSQANQSSPAAAEEGAADGQPGDPSHSGRRFDAPHSAMTVVEMAVAFDPPADAIDTDDELTQDSDMGPLSDAFDRGLQYVRNIQRAYYLARRRPIRLVARETLPFAIPFAVRRLFDDQGDSAPFPDALSMFLLHMNVVDRDPDLQAHELESVRSGLRWQSGNGVFTDYLEFVREADVALHLDRAYRPAVLFCATACEVLFDELLAHMLWEEGQRPEEAAGVFDSWLTARVKNQYHPRLGGSWGIDAPGPIARWFRDISGVRNRVVHGGYEPSLEEARAAREAVQELETYLADRVANKASSLPRTALVLPGADGLRRRGRWTSQIDQLQQDPSGVQWIETFARWRQVLQRSRSDSPVYMQPSAREAWVYLVVRVDGTTRWIVHDAAACMAAVVDADTIGDLGPEQRDGLDDLLRYLRDSAHEDVSIRVAGVSVPEPPADDWRPEYRLVPLAGVMVNGDDLDPA